MQYALTEDEKQRRKLMGTPTGMDANTAMGINGIGPTQDEKPQNVANRIMGAQNRQADLMMGVTGTTSPVPAAIQPPQPSAAARAMDPALTPNATKYRNDLESLTLLQGTGPAAHDTRAIRAANTILATRAQDKAQVKADTDLERTRTDMLGMEERARQERLALAQGATDTQIRTLASNEDIAKGNRENALALENARTTSAQTIENARLTAQKELNKPTTLTVDGKTFVQAGNTLLQAQPDNSTGHKIGDVIDNNGQQTIITGFDTKGRPIGKVQGPTFKATAMDIEGTNRRLYENGVEILKAEAALKNKNFYERTGTLTDNINRLKAERAGLMAVLNPRQDLQATPQNPTASTTKQPRTDFTSEEEALKAGLPPGTIITIGGRRARL